MAEEIEEKDEIEEAIIAERKSLEYGAKDEDLLKAITSAVTEAKSLKDIIDAIGKKNELYWRKGTDINPATIHPRRAKIVDNRIFMAVETLLPMMTAQTAMPVIVGDVENTVRETLIKVLTIAYEVKQKLQLKLQKVVRHWFLYRIGVWKYRWDEGFITEIVRPDKIGVDPRGTDDIRNCEYLYETLEDPLGDLIKEFPKKKKELLAKYGKENLKSKYKYIEFWGGGGEWVAWKLGELLLDKQKNPNFDYKEEGNNLFKEPRFPYLILNVFNLGKNLYDDTSLIEQAISLQDGVNKRKNQISDLTDENKKLIIASSEAISKQELQKFIDKYGMLGLWLDKGSIEQIKVLGGKPDAGTFNDLAHSIGEIDNVMGTHSTVRGERKEQETLGGRKLLAAGDYGRAETVILNIEQLMEDWYNAYLHMLKVYSLEDAEFSDGEETITLKRTDIPEGILVMVKKGSTLPVDRASRAEMAVKLAQFDKIDPETMFEELGYGNEEERTQKLFEWLEKTGKIRPEEGGGEGGQGLPAAQQLARLKKMMSSEKFKTLPPEQQKQITQQAREIIKRIKAEAGAK